MAIIPRIRANHLSGEWSTMLGKLNWGFSQTNGICAKNYYLYV